MDNPRAIFEQIKNNPQICKVILQSIDNRNERGSLPDAINTKFVREKSLAGAYYLARSKVVIIATSLAGFSHYSKFMSNRHQIIQLWHGIPLKRIGKLFPPETFWQYETDKYAATVCSSAQDKVYMQKAFAPIPSDRVWQTGLPRNDLILKKEAHLPDDYKSHLNSIRARLKGRKMVLYAPTWRLDESSTYCFSKIELEVLKKILDKHNAVLAFRGHANVRTRAIFDPEFNDVINVNDIPDANILLRLADVLVTDYSSIYIDFLITSKPIIYFAYDKENYVSERGFLYPLEEAYVDDDVSDVEGLALKLDEALSDGVSDPARYDIVTSLFHDYNGASAPDVCDNIKVLAGTKG